MRANWALAGSGHAMTAHPGTLGDVIAVAFVIAVLLAACGGLVLVIRAFARRDRRHAERMRRDHDEAAKYRDGNGDRQ